jgi:tetratricopeptide (TPR) repeat protein
MIGNDASAGAIPMRLQNGVGLLQQGRMEPAREVFSGILRDDPGNAFAHHLLGLIELQTGQLDAGIASLKRAIALNPADPVALGNLANGLREAGAYDEALEAYGRALALKPDFLDAYNNRGILLRALGRNAEALADYDRAVALMPGHPHPHGNRADALAALGRAGEALDSYDRALALEPRDAGLHYSRANLLAGQRRWEEAVAGYDRALALDPNHVQALVNRGNVLVDLHRAEAALASYDAALAVQPDLAQAWSNRGNALRALNRHGEALDSCERAIALDPGYADPLHNRGTVLAELGRYGEAIADYGLCLQLDPDMTDARLNLGFAHLATGDYARGWSLYQTRWEMTGHHRFVADRGFQQPLWLGAESLAGKTILLHSEQGLGDTLQFCRYVPRVAALGARVILEAEAPLMGVLASLAGVDRLAPRGAALPDFDLHCPLMSLPLAFATTLETIPADVPYLAADPDKIEAWKRRLGTRTRPRVGLVWSGGFRPDQPELWGLNERRNIPLGRLAALRGAAVEFHSLQKGEPAESELRAVAPRWRGPDIVDHAGELADFTDTAALIENLDLVISVDTSTAHLAGALGKPVWILNRFDNCWRWLCGRADSPWYPTARLFRQTRFGDWDEVVDEVKLALDQLA